MRTVVGYTGGRTKDPTYQSVCSGDGHTEAIRVEFDSSCLAYEELLAIFFRNCSADCASKVQYKNVIWFHTPEQKRKAFAEAERRCKLGKVDILEAQRWYDAEAYRSVSRDTSRNTSRNSSRKSTKDSSISSVRACGEAQEQ
jgi:peptide-methionine (S)-S-oxide reductase